MTDQLPLTRLPGESPCVFVNGLDGWSTCIVHGWGGGREQRRRVLICPEVNAADPAPAGPLDVERVVERAKRLQSAHHRLLKVTAVTCEACRSERARWERKG